MPELLIELLSEEIPARMQNRAAEDFKNLLTKSLADSGLTYEEAKAFCTPRRLAIHIAGIPVQTAGMREERKGPRLGAPEKAINGFLQAAGLSSVDEARVVSDPKKGDYYVAVTDMPGRDSVEVISECLPEMIRKFPWPKSMKWGTGSLRWVRPLHSVLCTFGPVEGDTEVIKFDLDGITVGNETQGHRFMGNERIKVCGFDDYSRKLLDAHVVLDAENRSTRILKSAREQANELGLELVEDEKLLEETVGLVEWPKVLTGQFDKSFLAIPEEVIRASIREHQKCFVMRDPKTGKLSNRFALVTNIDTVDGGKEIISGNERVIAARLSDAKFFWESDLNTKLSNMAPKLKKVVFLEKLGTISERVNRIRYIAGSLAEEINKKLKNMGVVQLINKKNVSRAVQLAKVDIISKMVIEFPELQGIMGRKYALEQGEELEVANAIEYHYKPIGTSDELPTEDTSVIVAIADKLEFLSCFWYLNEKPTGSRDPYALRRAALGLVRVILNSKFNIQLRPIIAFSLILIKLDDVMSIKYRHTKKIIKIANIFNNYNIYNTNKIHNQIYNIIKSLDETIMKEKNFFHDIHFRDIQMENDLFEFIAERLKGFLRDDGIRIDLIDAVFALKDHDNFTRLDKKVRALGDFIESHDGVNLLAGFKRSANILRSEEKKDGTTFDEGFKDDLLKEDAEWELAKLLRNVRKDTKSSIENEDFVGAMESLARLRPAVDRFFDEILVNSEEPYIRRNRLNILNEFRQATLEVADFAKIGS